MARSPRLSGRWRPLASVVVGLCALGSFGCPAPETRLSSLSLALEAETKAGISLNQKGTWSQTSPLSGATSGQDALTEPFKGIFLSPEFFAPNTPEDFDSLKVVFEMNDVLFVGPAPQGAEDTGMSLALTGGGESSRWPMDVEGIDVAFEDNTFVWTLSVEAALAEDPEGYQGAPPMTLKAEGSAKGELKVAVNCNEDKESAPSLCLEEVAPYDDATCTVESGDCPLPIANAFLGEGPASFDGDKVNMGNQDLICVEQPHGGHFCHARLKDFEAGGCVWQVQAVGLSAKEGKVVAHADPGCEPRHCTLTYRCTTL
jgi:hypothetical protein